MRNSTLKICLVASMVCSFALAEGAFIGVESDYSFKSNLKMKFNDGGKDTFKKAQAGIGIKGGYDFDMYRVYGSYVYDFQTSKTIVDEDGDSLKLKWLTHKFIVGADYTPSITDNFKLAVGPYTGYSRLKLKDSEGTKANTNGWIIGAKLGGIYSIDKNNELEFGFKTDRTDYKKVSKIDLKDVKETNYGLYIGYNYKF
ncbi:outer membrane beta-barrel protein [Campylobacter hyointestinalis]|uniref:outer membrane beta-barrel protein n=1 Tax=Campylobacter hyointestinalis TaxID=198 RepID=UPI0011ACFC47|nr:outer membrane beta-barrel protein [Campylobacter hyointestinalis]TWO21598.1 porin family protein [Campylobacter hyointestinalis]